MSERRWMVTTEQRQAQPGECYVYANKDQPPRVFPCGYGAPTNADDPGGPYRHVIVAIEESQ